MWPSPRCVLYKEKMPGPVKELDLRGLKCPLPALRTRKALRALDAGERLVIFCTDPLSQIDIPHLIRETRDVLEDSRAENDVFIFRVLRRG
jgi:tRNA 2-thiouridine synthesizing protein A